MTDEQQLWASALALERQHGAGAEMFAAKRVQQLTEQGDQAGAEIWKAIAARLVQLRSGGHA